MPLPMARKRSDAERRVRHSDRLARFLRVLQLIRGPGNWNAQSIAQELDCSERTVYRDLQTLSTAGMPLYFDELNQACKIREAYRGHRLDIPERTEPESGAADEPPADQDDPRSIVTLAKEAAQRLLVEAERVVQALDRLSQAIEEIAGRRPK
jgi:predicted DNA-binding transcriptional regulator YafY